MSWMNDHKREWRVVVLVLLLVSIIGPWIFDLIVVPSEYACLAPAIRLAGDYCGIPMSGIWILSAAAGILVNIVVGLVTGTTAFTDCSASSHSVCLASCSYYPFSAHCS